MRRLADIGSLTMAAVLVCCGPAHAASQGAMGAGSRGAITITASVAARADFASTVNDAASDDGALSYELRCLRLNSLNGGFRLLAVAAEPEKPALASASQVIGASTAHCSQGWTTRWRIAQDRSSDGTERPFTVMLVPQ